MKKVLFFILNTLKICIFVIIGIHFFVIIFVGICSLSFNFINPPTTSLMIYRKIFYNYKIKEVKFVNMKKIPKYIPRMIVSVEDYKFYKHNGIDIEAIQNAIKLNKVVGSNFYGGSTINQQLARTIFLVPKKVFVRKYFEMIIALEMNLLISKDRMLELYLNYVEWGKGIFGVEQASLAYFKKSAKNLTKDQSARLITILSSPIKYTPNNFYNRRILLVRYNFLSSL